MDLSGLARFSEEPKAKKAPVWRPVHPWDLAMGVVLAFDQSLASTGWVLLSVHGDSGSTVVLTGTLRNVGDPLKGSARVLERFDELRADLYDITRLVLPETLIVHESPPSAAMMRPESSLLAAAAVRTVFSPRKVGAVQGQHVKKVVTGNGNAAKPEVAKAVKAMTWIQGIDLLKNEHQRDALAIAVTFMIDEKVSHEARG
jgi:Holliday junction resolvasome RuvABC endonuclease subunit